MAAQLPNLGWVPIDDRRYSTTSLGSYDRGQKCVLEQFHSRGTETAGQQWNNSAPQVILNMRRNVPNIVCEQGHRMTGSLANVYNASEVAWDLGTEA